MHKLTLYRNVHMRYNQWCNALIFQLYMESQILRMQGRWYCNTAGLLCPFCA